MKSINMAEEPAFLLREQAKIMHTQIDHYLQRVRIAAQHDSIVSHTAVPETFNCLVKVMKKLNPGKHIQFTMDVNDIIFFW